MNVITNKLKKFDGYLISIDRNPEMGFYQIKVGLPIDWVYKEVEGIECAVLNKTNEGKILNISPKPNRDDINVDDLLLFFEKIIETNEIILEKQNEFSQQMEEFKKMLEDKENAFYAELNELKEVSFNNFTEIKKEEPETIEKPKPPKKTTKKEEIQDE